jgi:energy-coupling factor transport system ATP-binding protein
MSPLLYAREVRYRYPQNGHGLPTTSLRVAPGERVLIAGPSGGGKSTLARCITGLIPHLYHGTLEGEIRLDGHPTIETPLWRLAEHAGLVFQNPGEQMLTHAVAEEIIFGLENLGLPRDEIDARLEATLDRFDLVPLRDRAPQTLSGGEQQKLALAAILARRPALLVLDEPLSMLDTTASFALLERLETLADAGTAVVICEHRARYVATLSELRTLHLGAAPDDEARAALPTPPLSTVPTFRLEVDALGVRLGGQRVLQDLSFTADGGEVVAVVGRNGVGKTTLLRTLAGLQQHSGGVTVEDKPPEFGLVFQNADLQLFNATVREEIRYRVADPDEARYTWLLDALGLRAYEQTPPLLLSEGEKKRVALATALMRAPRHGVLLDEPALGQDTRYKRRIVRMARALAETGRLVLLTTHDLPMALQADRLILLGADGIAADGPPDTVLRDHTAWERIGLRVPPWIRPREKVPV